MAYIETRELKTGITYRVRWRAPIGYAVEFEFTVDFEDFANRYAGRFRVIAVDFRGRGMSERDPQPARYLPLTYASDVLQLLDELGVDKAVFIGTSLAIAATALVMRNTPRTSQSRGSWMTKV